jgi:hypothetical protein
MKVRVEVTLEVDPEVWDLNYGTGTEARFVREDVKSYVQNMVADHFTELGIGAAR